MHQKKQSNVGKTFLQVLFWNILATGLEASSVLTNFVYEEVVLSPQCTNQCSPDCTEHHKPCLCLDVLSLAWTSFCLSVLVGRK